MDELPRNLSSFVTIPKVSAVSRIMTPLVPVKAGIIHSTTAVTSNDNIANMRENAIMKPHALIDLN